MTRANEVIEKSWWCTYCYALIEDTPEEVHGLHVVDHYADHATLRLQ